MNPKLQTTILVLVAFSLFAPSSSLDARSGPTRETILKAWKAREKRIRSAVFAWTDRVTIPKGRVSDSFPGTHGKRTLETMGIGSGEVVPPQDTTYEVPVTLSIDQGKMRYTRDDRCWSGQKKQYVPDPYLSTFDGKQAKLFHPLGVPYNQHPSGSIRAESHHVDVGGIHVSPIVVTVRPTHTAFRTTDWRSMTLSNTRSRILGRDCIELQQRVGPFVSRIWIDPERDYVMVRRLDTINEHVLIKSEIDYQQLDDYWIPHTWTIVLRDGRGRFEESVQATMKKVEINSVISEREFDIIFPPGTYVIDNTCDRRYILEADGGERTVAKHERNMSYAELMSTSSASRGIASRQSLLWVVVAVVAVLLCGLGWRQWRSTKLPSVENPSSQL